MPPVSKVGVSTVVGGVVIGPGAPTVLVKGVPISTVGDLVASHTPFTGLHTAALMVGCSTTVKAEGRFICRNGDLAGCGHAVIAGEATVVNNI